VSLTRLTGTGRFTRLSPAAWCSGNVLTSHSGGILFESPAGQRDILGEAFRGLPQTLQANAGILPQFGQDRFLPNPVHFYDTICFYVVCILTACHLICQCGDRGRGAQMKAASRADAHISSVCHSTK
jgi:hypothetical protein